MKTFNWYLSLSSIPKPLCQHPQRETRNVLKSNIRISELSKWKSHWIGWTWKNVSDLPFKPTFTIIVTQNMLKYLPLFHAQNTWCIKKTRQSTKLVQNFPTIFYNQMQYIHILCEHTGFSVSASDRNLWLFRGLSPAVKFNSSL